MLLKAQNIVKKFPQSRNFWGRAKTFVHAVSDVSLEVEAGKTVGLVGESGCGKSTLARILMRLIATDSGSIYFEGQEISRFSERKLRPLRQKFQMIFQDPYSSLNPRMSIGQILTEPLIVHGLGDSAQHREKVEAILRKVGLTEETYAKYPHEFSGGQRQRIGIARALILYPQLIIADEPVSALDVSVQAQIINLLDELQREFQLAYLLIAHDLKVVRHLSQKILVMYLGHIVEEIDSPRLSEARHPYTHALLQAVPKIDPTQKLRRALPGDVPSPIHPPSGCVFHTRCPYVQKICSELSPVLENLQEGHRVACHLVNEVPPFSQLEKNESAA